jgi:hypothetical protein
MRTSFHHQPEAQHPIFQLSTSWQADYPIFRCKADIAQRLPADRDLWLHDLEGDQLFCRRRRKHTFDCSSLRSEQVALTSFGRLPR